jgi:hypothetical protein
MEGLTVDITELYQNPNYLYYNKSPIMGTSKIFPGQFNNFQNIDLMFQFKSMN